MKKTKDVREVLGVEIDTYSTFFDAAASFTRTRPEALLRERTLLSFSIETFGIVDATLLILARPPLELTLYVFEELIDSAPYVNTPKSPSENAAKTPYLVIDFGMVSKLPPAFRKAIEHHGFALGPLGTAAQIAGREENTRRDPVSEEVEFAEHLLRALTHLMAERPALRHALRSGEHMNRIYELGENSTRIELWAPHELMTTRRVSYESVLLEKLAELEGDGIPDIEARQALEDDLLAYFSEAPEAAGLEHFQHVHTVLDLAASHLGKTVSSVSAPDLVEVLFDVMPVRVRLKVEETEDLVLVMRAFYQFLKREYALEQADACLVVLNRTALKKLERAFTRRGPTQRRT